MQDSASTAPSASLPSTAWDDGLLLTAIGLGANESGTGNRRIAEMALRVFMDRWGSLVETLVNRWCSMPPAIYVGVDAVLSMLWQRVFFRAGQFDSGSLEGDALRASVCAWLKAIALNALLNACRKFENCPLTEFSDEVLPAIARREAAPIIHDDDDDPSPAQLRMTAMLECLQERKEREIIVLRACAKFLHANQEDDSMPDEIRADLCARFQITPENLRQIRTRAMQRLKLCATGKLAQLEREE
jgi:hypothetical protein